MSLAGALGAAMAATATKLPSPLQLVVAKPVSMTLVLGLFTLALLGASHADKELSTAWETPPALETFSSYEDMQRYFDHRNQRRLRHIENPLKDSYIEAYNQHNEEEEEKEEHRYKRSASEQQEVKSQPALIKFEMADAVEPSDEVKQLIRQYKSRELQQNERYMETVPPSNTNNAEALSNPIVKRNPTNDIGKQKIFGKRLNRPKRSMRHQQPANFRVKYIPFDVTDAREPDNHTKNLIKRMRALEIERLNKQLPFQKADNSSVVQADHLDNESTTTKKPFTKRSKFTKQWKPKRIRREAAAPEMIKFEIADAKDPDPSLKTFMNTKKTRETKDLKLESTPTDNPSATPADAANSDQNSQDTKRYFVYKEAPTKVKKSNAAIPHDVQNIISHLIKGGGSGGGGGGGVGGGGGKAYLKYIPAQQMDYNNLKAAYPIAKGGGAIYGHGGGGAVEGGGYGNYGHAVPVKFVYHPVVVGGHGGGYEGGGGGGGGHGGGGGGAVAVPVKYVALGGGEAGYDGGEGSHGGGYAAVGGGHGGGYAAGGGGHGGGYDAAGYAAGGAGHGADYAAGLGGHGGGYAAGGGVHGGGYAVVGGGHAGGYAAGGGGHGGGYAVGGGGHGGGYAAGGGGHGGGYAVVGGGHAGGYAASGGGHGGGYAAGGGGHGGGYAVGGGGHGGGYAAGGGAHGGGYAAGGGDHGAGYPAGGGGGYEAGGVAVKYVAAVAEEGGHDGGYGGGGGYEAGHGGSYGGGGGGHVVAYAGGEDAGYEGAKGGGGGGNVAAVAEGGYAAGGEGGGHGGGYAAAGAHGGGYADGGGHGAGLGAHGNYAGYGGENAEGRGGEGHVGGGGAYIAAHAPAAIVHPIVVAEGGGGQQKAAYGSGLAEAAAAKNAGNEALKAIPPPQFKGEVKYSVVPTVEQYAKSATQDFHLKLYSPESLIAKAQLIAKDQAKAIAEEGQKAVAAAYSLAAAKGGAALGGGKGSYAGGKEAGGYGGAEEGFGLKVGSGELGGGKGGGGYAAGKGGGGYGGGKGGGGYVGAEGSIGGEVGYGAAKGGAGYGSGGGGSGAGPVIKIEYHAPAESYKGNYKEVPEFQQLSSLVGKSPEDQIHGLTYLLAKEMQNRLHLQRQHNYGGGGGGAGKGAGGFDGGKGGGYGGGGEGLDARPQDNKAPVLFLPQEAEALGGGGAAEGGKGAGGGGGGGGDFYQPIVGKYIGMAKSKQYIPVIEQAAEGGALGGKGGAGGGGVAGKLAGNAYGLSPNYKGLGGLKAYAAGLGAKAAVAGGDEVFNANGYEEAAAKLQSYASKYAFGYRIRDFNTGNDFGHKQNRDLHGVTRGQYHILLPDGRIQNVIYHADDTGFHADVSFESGR